jgi:hypothetical protein
VFDESTMSEESVQAMSMGLAIADIVLPCHVHNRRSNAHRVKLYFLNLTQAK